MHRELAGRSFTDALLRLAGDRVGSYLCFLWVMGWFAEVRFFLRGGIEHA